MAQQIKNMEDLKGLMREGLGELVREHPQIFLDAMASNKDGMRAALEKAGINIAETATDTSFVDQARRSAIDSGEIIGGFGARTRAGLVARTVFDGATGQKRRTYLYGEGERLANEWVRAMMSKDGRHPETNEDIRAIAEKLNKATRAPATPLSIEGSNAGMQNLVPTVIAAEIFEEMNERFVLQNRVQSFTSAAPLQIPKRIGQVTMSRGASASDLPESNFASTLGNIKLAPERVGCLTYIDPMLALAAAVGPVRWVLGQIAEAMAKDLQRVIVNGDTTQREPQGIMKLPITGSLPTYELAKTQAWDDTARASRRDSVRKLFYKIAQQHREKASFLFITNNDGMQLLASMNDMDQRPFVDGVAGQLPQFMGKDVVETLAISTVTGSPNTTTLLCGDMSMYAYVESPDGLRIEQTNIGGAAWVSDTIGIKAIQWYDGAPIIPSVFGNMTPTFTP